MASRVAFFCVQALAMVLPQWGGKHIAGVLTGGLPAHSCKTYQVAPVAACN